MAEDLIPNDVAVGGPAEGAHRPLVLITGPNMGGKSTLMRQTALICLLAQLVGACCCCCITTPSHYNHTTTTTTILITTTTIHSVLLIELPCRCSIKLVQPFT